MPGTSSVGATGSQDIDGLLSGVKWSTSNLTFSFPASAGVYGYNFYGEVNTFGTLSAAAQTAVRAILDMYESVANITFTELTGSQSGLGDLRFADTDATSTAWAYYPSSQNYGGDVWVRKSGAYGGYYDSPQKGDYGYFTYIHEIGHALGLKHGHETDGYGALPADHDSMEYSVMTYRSYVGASTSGGYTNESSGFAQTLMQNDIAALQYMYGANFTYNSGNTVYSWSTTTGELSINGVGQGGLGGNRVFGTIWDGGGIDTYDFSNYATDLAIDLAPGAWSTVSSIQRAYLGGGYYATGNIANALLYQGNAASLIENAVGGSGNDTITGNAAGNRLNGGAGIDSASYAASPQVSWGPAFGAFSTQPNGVLVDLYTNQNSYGHASGDVLTSIENLIGSQFNDFLLGDLAANILNGSDGDDFVFGRFGADTIHGGVGNDTLFGDDASGYPDGTPGIGYGADQLFGEEGNDALYGEGGADWLSGGPGTDLLDYSTSPFGVTADLVNRDGYGPQGSYASGDSYAADPITGRCDIENVRGSSFDDILIGDTGANILEGGGGNDLLIGSVGADILAGGAAVDSFAISSVSEGGDIIVDFDAQAGELIDLRSLFAAHGLSTSDPIGDGVLSIEGLGGGAAHTVVNIDLDGSAGATYAPSTLYTLVNVDPDSLVPGHHIIWM